MKRGQEYENLTAEIFSKLSESKYDSIVQNAFIDGPDGKREIDILLESRIAGIKIRVIIECKDYNKNVNVTAIDQLHSKMQDVHANRAILVARKGFSRGAKQKASRLGITLCTARQAQHDKWGIEIKLPVIVEEHSLEYIQGFHLVKFPDPPPQALQQTINGTPIIEHALAYWKSLNVLPPLKDDSTFRNSFHKDNECWFTSENGDKIYFEEYALSFKVRKRYYLGYLNDIESTQYIHYFDSSSPDRVIISIEDLFQYRGAFQEVPPPLLEGMNYFKVISKIDRDISGKANDMKIQDSKGGDVYLIHVKININD